MGSSFEKDIGVLKIIRVMYPKKKVVAGFLAILYVAYDGERPDNGIIIGNIWASLPLWKLTFH